MPAGAPGAPAAACSLPLVAAAKPFSSQHLGQNHEKFEMSHAFLASRPAGAGGGLLRATSFRGSAAAAAPSSARLVRVRVRVSYPYPYP